MQIGVKSANFLLKTLPANMTVEKTMVFQNLRLTEAYMALLFMVSKE